MPSPSFLRTRLRGIRFAGLALLAAIGPALDAQIPFPATDGFDPNPNGIVTTLALQPDGKILMGGYFTQVRPFGSPVSGNGHIARLNHDGSVDAAFNPSANDVVRTLLLQSNGQIVMGGQFTAVQPAGGGAAATRMYAARLNADGSLDTVFNPNANGVVYAVAVQANGQIIIGGSFTAVQPSGAAGPTTRNHIARFNVDGSLDTSFDPNADRPVLSLAVEPNGQIVVGGGFSKFQPNGKAAATTRNCVARLNSDGSLDTGFDPEANGSVMAIAILPNGQIVLGGEFVTFQPNGATGTTQADFLARLNSDGSLDTGFIVNPLASVTALAVQGDGKLLIGGNFTSIFTENSLGSSPITYAARINPDGSIDTAYDPGPNQAVNAIVVQPDGAAILGGYFTQLLPPDLPSSVRRNFIARVGADGSLDTTLAPDAMGGIFAAATLPNGQMIVGGTFQSIAGVTQSYLARLNANGTLDPLFAPTLNGSVQAIAVQSNGQILVGGNFTEIDGIPRNYMARLNTDGSVDGPFNPSPNAKVVLIVPQTNGQIIISGFFTVLVPNGATTGVGVNFMARINSDGSADLTFNPNLSGGAVFALATQSDGKILVAGEFTSVGGLARGYVARLLSSGTLDPVEFDPEANGPVYAMAIQQDGKILIGGTFNAVAPQTGKTGTSTTTTGPYGTVTLPAPGTNATSFIYVNHLARLNADGTLDTTFYPDPSDTVLALAIQSNGSIVLGGTMTSFAPNGSPTGTIRNYIGRIGSGGSLDATFNPSANGQVDVVNLLSNGQILIGGTFTTLQPNGASAPSLESHLAILNADGTVNPSLAAGTSTTPSGQIDAMALQPSGQLLVGGSFGPIDGAPGSNLVRFNADGGPDLSYNPVFDGPVNAIAVQPTGSAVSAPSSYALWLESNGAIRHPYSAASNGLVNVVVQQANGQVLVGGLFSNFAGTSGYQNLVRLNVDGTVDAAFNPSPTGAVGAIALQPDGKILVGGSFTTITGVPYQYLARLNSDGTLDSTFNPSPNAGVTCIALQSNGQVITGGFFTSVETASTTLLTSRGYIARFNTDGTLDAKFDPVLSGTPSVIDVLSNGQILVGGSFSTITPNGTGTPVTRNNIARLNSDGSVDANFDPEANSQVDAIAVMPNGQLYIGGGFTEFEPNAVFTTGTNGITTATGTVYNVQYLGRLNADGTVDTTFKPDPNSSVATIALQSNGQLIVGGGFTGFNTNGSAVSTTRDFIARLSADGSVDSTFDPGLNNAAISIAVLQDGSVFVGGNFTAVETGGAILVGGSFTHVGGIPQPHLVRLNADSTVNATFTANTDGPVNALTPQPDGRTLVGGAFSNIAGQAIPNLARLNADSTLDTSFNPSPNGPVNAIAVWPNGEIIIGGSFISVGGQPTANLALLNSTGSPIASFAPAVNGTVNSVLVLPTGQLVIGGAFTSVDGLTVGRIARLNADGTVDPTFNPNANGTVEALSLQVDGTILIAGAFTTIGGNPISHAARIGSNGAVDTTFNPGPNGVVNAVLAQPDGRVVLGGSFTVVAGQSRFDIARISTPTQVTQSLTVSSDESTITWTRTGGAPALASARIEESTDGTNYKLVGQATSPDGMTWQIAGIPSTGSTVFYVRATGVTPSSRYSSSGLIQTIELINILADPVITSAPQASGVPGAAFSFTVTATRSPKSYSASGLPPGLIINTATGLISGTPAASGTYNVAVTAIGAGGSSTSNLTISIASSGGSLTPAASPGNRLLNLSSRDELSGSQILIAGFVIAGTGQKDVVLRAVGPGLAAFSVPGFMATPELQLYSSSGALIAQNSGWGSGGALSAAFAQVGAFALSPSSADAAAEISLSPGSYTVQVSDPAGKGGVVLTEIYDASPSPLSAPQRLINISARGAVSSGAGALIGGFVISGDSTKTVLIRGVGPGLAAFGVANTLADPVLSVYDSNGNLVARNVSWGNQIAEGAGQVAGADIISTDASVGAFVLAAGSADTALVVNLPPGAYTFQVTSASNSTGEALGEVYEVP